MAERFKSEIKLARKVRHKNVCAIHDYGEERACSTSPWSSSREWT